MCLDSWTFVKILRAATCPCMMDVVHAIFRTARRVGFAVGTALGLCLASCGGSDKSSSSSGPPNETVQSIDDFVAALSSAYCEMMFSCYVPNDDVVGQVAALGTEDRCRASVRISRW